METIITILTLAGFASMIFRGKLIYKNNLVDQVDNSSLVDSSSLLDSSSLVDSSLIGVINEGAALDLGSVESRLKVIIDNFFSEINVNPQFVEQRNTSKWVTDLSEMISTGNLSPEHTEAALKALKEVCLLLP